MKVIHTISSMGIKSGGTTACVYNMLLHKNNYETTILTYSLQEDDYLIGNGVNIKFINKQKENSFQYSPEYKKALENEECNLYHSHGLWEYMQYGTANIAQKKNKPYIITPHGMLYPSALAISKIKKQIALRLYLKRHLKKANCIHCTSQEEATHIRNLGIKTPIAIIPNAVEIPILDKKNTLTQKRNKIAFIGRLSSIKNIESLIMAWSNLGDITEQYQLSIVGDGECMEKLQNLSQNLKINNIEFPGFIKGDEKITFYNSIKYLVLPSFSENFGMVVAEALAHKIPVIASKGTPWEDLETYNCGWWVENDVEILTDTMKTALKISNDEWLQMGENGKILIEEKYSTKVIAEKLEKLYFWILNKGEKPDFVQID